MSQVPAWFDDKAYFANKMAQVNETATTQYEAADFAAALKAAGVDPNNPKSLYNHFVNFGNAEGVSPNGYFDADAYIANKAAQAGSTVEAVEQAFKDAGLSAWDHYQAFGTKEGINPSASFNTDEYLQAKVDYELAKGNAITLDQLKATLAENNLSALEHYYLYGQAEGVSYSPADYPAFPAIPVDGGYEPLPTAGKTVAEAEAGLGDGSLTAGSFYIQDDVSALNGAKFTVLNSAKGIYVADSVDNLSASNAAGILAQADHVIIADSFANLVMKELPSFGDTPTSLLVNAKVPSTINLGDVTVAKAADAQNTLDNFLARSDVEYAKDVTKPTEVTVGTYSIKDTAAAVAAADATLLDDADSVTVADTMAALTSNFSLIDSGDIDGVELKDSLTNIANASTTIIKGLEANGSFSAAATNTGSAKVNFTDALNALSSISLSEDLDSLTVVGKAENEDGVDFGNVSKFGIASGADTTVTFEGTKYDDTFTVSGGDQDLGYLTLKGGDGVDTLNVTKSAAGNVDLGSSLTSIEKITVALSSASDTFSMKADSALTSLSVTVTSGSGATTLDLTDAAKLESLTLGSGGDAAVDTIKIGDATGTEASGGSGFSITNFKGGAGGDTLDISALLDGATIAGVSGSGSINVTDKNVILYTSGNSVDASGLSPAVTSGLAANTDYVVIAASGSGSNAIYVLNCGNDTTIDEGDLVQIGSITTTDAAIASGNIADWA